MNNKWVRLVCEPLFREGMMIRFLLTHDNSSSLKCLISEYLKGWYNMIFSKNVKIGQDIYFLHSHNVIVGGISEIGNGCIVYHNVTIGNNVGWSKRSCNKGHTR